MSASAVSMDKLSSRRRFDSSGGRTVLPEPANSKTYLESVVSFVKGLSQAYSQTTITDEKETVVWVRFFSYADTCGYEGLEQTNASLLLVLGYSNGMQMWNLMANGEAQEMFSLRDGPVKTACLLPPPPPSSKSDDLHAKRPLMAVCLATDSKQIFASVAIQSLRTGEQVKRLQFASDVMSVRAGPSCLFLVALRDSVHAFQLRTLECVFVVNGCSSVQSNMTNPVAIGTRWLAYSPAVPLTNLQSSGGISGDGAQSYVTSMLNAAKTISKGISTVGDTVNWLASKSRLTSSLDETSLSTSPRSRLWGATRSMSGSSSSDSNTDTGGSGLVTILDVSKIEDNLKQDDNGRAVPVEINCEVDKELVVAHFVAHVDQSITRMELAPSGRLLATADQLGHAFHVFSILPHPGGSSLATVHHLYTLWRGKTPAEVQELRFSWDCRWLIASTLRGTCHIFPIAPYGGTPNVRTHTSNRVVNRSSTFHKSAGLDEMEYYEPPLPPNHRQLSDSSNVLAQLWHNQHKVLAPRSLPSFNPRLPPYPQPLILHAVDHIRLGQTPSAALPGVLPAQSSFMTSQPTDSTATPLSRAADVVIATRFLQSTRNEKSGSKATSFSGSSGGGSQHLLIASSTGYMSEYLLEPRPRSGINKVSDESPVEAVAKEGVCWPLQRQTNWTTVPISLPLKNTLIYADNVCRRHYELTRYRLKEKVENRIVMPNNGISSDNPSDLRFPPSSQSVRREQPRSKNHDSRRAKAKKSSSLTNNMEQLPPVSAEIHRNGNTRLSNDESPTSCEDLKSLSSPVLASTSPASEEWLSQVEMVTHEGPARRLWMGPQFHFKRFVSTGSTHVLSSVSSAVLSNQQHPVDPYSDTGYPEGGTRGDALYEEELDVHSLHIHSMRSDPVPTPGPRNSAIVDDNEPSSLGCCTTIEAGSGNFDRAAHMLEITAFGSTDERRYSSYGSNGCEDKLRERIADAMLDLNGEHAKLYSSTPPFANSASPKHRLMGRSKPDGTEYGSLPIETDHFDFTHLEAPPVTMSGKK